MRKGETKRIETFAGLATTVGESTREQVHMADFLGGKNEDCAFALASG